jgi:hypothetical protein
VKKQSAVVHTEGVPPKMGSTRRPARSSSVKSANAERPMAAMKSGWL